MGKKERLMERVDWHRGGEGRNFLLLFAIFYVLGETLGVRIWRICEPVYFLLSKRVHDGYWLVLLGPAVLLSWVAGGIVTVVLYAIPAALALVLAPILLIISGLFELPSDFINSKKEKESFSFTEEFKTALMISGVAPLVALLVIAIATAS